MKVGIPKTLAYYMYFPLWKGFFDQLGIEVILSSDTNRSIVDEGVRLTVNDACVPIKLFHGHAHHLFSQVDYLFVPRLISMDGKHIYCPKFLGLPDMVRAASENCPPMLMPKFDLRRGIFNLWRGFREIGRAVGAGTVATWKAYRRGLKEQRRFNQLLQQGFTAEQSLEILTGAKEEGDFRRNLTNRWKVAVLGYPYIIYDPYISQRLISRLRDRGIRIVTQDMLAGENLDQ